MDRIPDNHAYRCLPLNIANSHGWEILSPCAFEVAWRGGMPQLWPEPAGRDSDDPWNYLLTASSRDPGWPRVLEWCAFELSVIT